MHDLIVSSSLGAYYDFASRRGIGIAIIVREDSLPFLKEGGKHWVLALNLPVFVFRAGLSDFESLEIGVHPKVIVYQDGSEIADFDGIPTYRRLKAVLK